MLVGHDLDFNMPWILEKLLHVNLGIAKGGTGLGLGSLHRVQQCRFGVHHAHAAAAASARGLDDDRIAHLLGRALDHGRVIRQCALGSGYAGHTCLDHGLLGRNLVAHDANGFGRGADELEAAFLNPLGKVCVLAQEAVTRVNCLCVGNLCGRNDGRHIEVTVCGRGRPDADRLVGKLDIFGVSVSFRVNHHRLDAKLPAGALDAQGDFTAVCNQYFFKHASVKSVCSGGLRRNPSLDQEK